MKIISRYIVFISLAFSLYNCENSNPEQNKSVEDYISNMDGKNLEEINEEITELYGVLKSYDNFYNKVLSSNKIKHIEKEDEQFEPVFKTDTIIINKALNQFKNVIFTQRFYNYHSKLMFGFKNDSDKKVIRLSDKISQKFIPQKIYYKNGTIQTNSISDCEIEFEFDGKWKNTSPIDSIDIMYTIKYTSDYDEITLSKDIPQVKYKGGVISLEEITGNYVYIIESDTIRTPIKIQAYNADGKSLYSNGYSNSDIKPGKQEGVLKEMIAYLEKTKKELNNNKFATVEEYKNHIRKDIGDLEYFKDTDGLFHRELYFKGTIETVKLFFSKEKREQKVHFTAKNKTKFKDLNMMPIDSGMAFLNIKGEKLFTVKGSEYESITNRYFEDDDYYYHLNLKEKRMDTLLVYDITACDNGLVKILKNQEEDDYVLYSEEYKKVNDHQYEYIVDNEGVLFGNRNDDFYFINKNGKETLLKNVDRIKESTEGMTIILNEDSMYGFVNEKGEVTVPMIYDEVDNFSDGLANVKKPDSDLEGYINKKGKIVLPFIYEYADEFINGVACVKYNETYKLIDRNGNVKVETNSTGVSINGSGNDRTYTFSESEYNAFGELVEE